MNIYEMIQEYGHYFYALVTVWTFLEGETIVLFAGAAARKGVIDLYTLIACAWIGSFLGDQLYFSIGRIWGVKVLERFPKFKPKVDKALVFLHNYSTGFILTFRFIYGIRNVASFAMGMSGISWLRFAILNFIAAGVWGTSFAIGGYLAGAALEGIVGEYGLEIMMIGLGIFLLVSLILWLRNTKNKKLPLSKEG